MNIEETKLAEAPEQVANEQPKPLASSIDFDGEKFTVIVPVIAGKAGVYGVLEVAKEQASKYFYAVERKMAEEEAKQKSILSRLHIPGVRTH